MSREQFLARYGSAKHIDELMKGNPSVRIKDSVLENPFATDAHVQNIFDGVKEHRLHSYIIRSLLDRPNPPNGLHEHIVRNDYDGNIFKKAVQIANKDQLDHIARNTRYQGATGVLLDKIVEHPLADDHTTHNLMMNKNAHIVRHFMDDDIKPEHLKTIYENHTDHGLQFDAINHENAPADILTDAIKNHPRDFIRKTAICHPNTPLESVGYARKHDTDPVNREKAEHVYKNRGGI